ncbi:MAG: hypothetical protein ABL932_16445 [Terricaulis sp.]
MAGAVSQCELSLTNFDYAGFGSDEAARRPWHRAQRHSSFIRRCAVALAAFGADALAASEGAGKQ